MGSRARDAVGRTGIRESDNQIFGGPVNERGRSLPNSTTDIYTDVHVDDSKACESK